MLGKTLSKKSAMVALFGGALAISGCTQERPASMSASPKAQQAEQTPKAKNIILFIGDGMGVSTVTAARIYDGQSRGETGEENLLSFERFPNVALVKTYNSNQQVSDSAGTASAMNTGVKTLAGVFGVGPDVRRGDCDSQQQHKLPNFADIAAEKGKAIGIVSTARITHATPAAVYAHSSERDWENDSEMPEVERAKGCKDIAAQLVDYDFTVALGGGRGGFFGKDGKGRRAIDAEALPDVWAARTNGNYVENLSAMRNAEVGKPLLGLFTPSHMSYMLDRKADSAEPTLTDMTATALRHVSPDPDGYYLMVEGGRIDHGHHMGQAGYALSEAQEFARAVAYAVANTDPAETLILVTADHSHVFTIAGYPTRGNPILGLVKGNDDSGKPEDEPSKAADGLPYTTLGYANGPGAISGQRKSPETGPKAVQQAAIPTGYGPAGKMQLVESHGGEDVALYATGPGSDAARGVIEQNRIFNIMKAAFGLE